MTVKLHIILFPNWYKIVLFTICHVSHLSKSFCYNKYHKSSACKIKSKREPTGKYNVYTRSINFILIFIVLLNLQVRRIFNFAPNTEIFVLCNERLNEAITKLHGFFTLSLCALIETKIAFQIFKSTVAMCFHPRCASFRFVSR